ncbi:FKBP-type peptidyl-prolyl cis-trans isomerase [Schaalia hyovaginalis]|uniref:FKBP-type peptidyl-prolyl cis-trans isomerase n=1 Tax=Schaalia hyovaginalis TaxID=29316 RepID=UPI0026F21FEE|nr:FKBP-type peptidyl-prolyl cis-trans isomerase [Schaalia hyovaginalis]MCI6412051.1 FKBP-type peptidyl-prolyl cis-trans isomerase [Schaalia hyovaginalis]
MKKTVRARIGALALSMALVASLAACSSADSAQSASSDQSSAQSASAAPEVDRSGKANFPDVTGGFGEDPEISTGKGEAPTKISVKTLNEGKGEALTTTDTVMVNYELALWDGTKVESSFETGKPATFSLQQVIPGWTYGLEGAHVGDRVEIVVPSEFGYGDQGNSSIPGGSTLVFVVDVLASSSGSQADAQTLSKGQPSGEAAPEGIVVEGEAGKEPTLSFTEGAAAPAGDSRTTIINGAGDEIKAGDYVLYRAVGGVFGDNATVSSAWQQGPLAVPADQVELVGAHVGDRVVFVMDTGAAAESGASPMTVMVIDLVGVMRAQ